MWNVPFPLFIIAIFFFFKKKCFKKEIFKYLKMVKLLQVGNKSGRISAVWIVGY